MYKPFLEWLADCQPHYQITDGNRPNLTLMGEWAMRLPAFEKPELGRYLDKGLILTGNVGSGKTEAMRLLNAYLIYLKSPYVFKTGVVWRFAENFKKNGYDAFISCNTGNKYYDELALTDEKTGYPVNELVGHYGEKILIGERLILKRYSLFKSEGWLTHFSSNCSPAELQGIYGQRAYSRLTEMGNFISFVGPDWRAMIRPTFYLNRNAPPPAAGSPISLPEILAEKRRLNALYESVKSGITPDTLGIDYYSIKNLGLPVAHGPALEKIAEQIRGFRQIEVMTGNPSIKDVKRFNELAGQYATDNLDTEERGLISNRARCMAVIQLFQQMASENNSPLFSDL